MPQRDPSWTPQSWRAFPCAQQPVYPDRAALERTLAQIAALPPLVTSYIESLKTQIVEASRGERFILRRVTAPRASPTAPARQSPAKLKILLLMSLVLVHGTRKRDHADRALRGPVREAAERCSRRPVDGVRAADLPRRQRRIAPEPDARRRARRDPTLLLLRGSERCGAHAELRPFARRRRASRTCITRRTGTSSSSGTRRSRPSTSAWSTPSARALRFMETLAGGTIAAMQRVDFYTSHELLGLEYEATLTRQVPRREGWFNLSTHLPWIGVRTRRARWRARRQFCRGIRNPVGVKVGPRRAHRRRCSTPFGRFRPTTSPAAWCW
jgi:3-deoxy-7-phosphoheptulonate synthase